VFRGGRAIPIDFNDCGPGYLVYDLAVPIEHRLLAAERAPEREALLRGYAGVRTPPPEFETHLDVFVVCRTVGNAHWAAGEARRDEHCREVLPRVLDRAVRISRDFLAGRSPIEV
jgi:Ser/Thr protein kinase RdoA (MazF antagonist)